MEIKIDDKELKNHVSEAVFAALSEEGRRKIITEGIAEALKKDGYGSISHQVNLVVQEVAKEAAKKLLVSDARLMGQIDSMAREALESVLKKDREKLVEKMASNIAATFTGGRLY